MPGRNRFTHSHQEKYLTQYRLYLLGSPGIEHNGRATKVKRRKALALLAYLAVIQTNF